MERSIEQQNRNRNKKQHRQKGGKNKQKEEEDDGISQELKDEAARLGCEVWEVEAVKAKLEQEGSDESSDDEPNTK